MPAGFAELSLWRIGVSQQLYLSRIIRGRICASRNFGVEDQLRPSNCGEKLKQLHVFARELPDARVSLIVIFGLVDNSYLMPSVSAGGGNGRDVANCEAALAPRLQSARIHSLHYCACSC
jgi:hypothetical protein